MSAAPLRPDPSVFSNDPTLRDKEGNTDAFPGVGATAGAELGKHILCIVDSTRGADAVRLVLNLKDGQNLDELAELKNLEEFILHMLFVTLEVDDPCINDLFESVQNVLNQLKEATRIIYIPEELDEIVTVLIPWTDLDECHIETTLTTLEENSDSVYTRERLRVLGVDL